MKNLSAWAVNIGLLLVAAGILLPILSQDPFNTTFRWVYAVGAALTLIGRLIQPAYIGRNMRVKRLLRLESWSALLFCVAAFFSVYSAPMLRDWLAFTLAGGAVQAYTSIALPMAQRKG
jgi:hypothetical protein